MFLNCWFFIYYSTILFPTALPLPLLTFGEASVASFIYNTWHDVTFSFKNVLFQSVEPESRDKNINAKSIVNRRNKTTHTLYFPAAGEKEVGNEWSSNTLSHPAFLPASENVAGSQAMSSAQHAVIMQRKWISMKYLGLDRKQVMNCCSGTFHFSLTHPFVSPTYSRSFFLFVFFKTWQNTDYFSPHTLCSSLFSYLTALLIPFLSYLLECRLSGEHVRLFTPAALSLIVFFFFLFSLRARLCISHLNYTELC